MYDLISFHFLDFSKFLFLQAMQLNFTRVTEHTKSGRDTNFFDSKTIEYETFQWPAIAELDPYTIWYTKDGTAYTGKKTKPGSAAAAARSATSTSVEEDVSMDTTELSTVPTCSHLWVPARPQVGSAFLSRSCSRTLLCRLSCLLLLLLLLLLLPFPSSPPIHFSLHSHSHPESQSHASQVDATILGQHSHPGPHPVHRPIPSSPLPSPWFVPLLVHFSSGPHQMDGGHCEVRREDLMGGRGGRKGQWERMRR